MISHIHQLRTGPNHQTFFVNPNIACPRACQSRILPHSVRHRGSYVQTSSHNTRRIHRTMTPISGILTLRMNLTIFSGSAPEATAAQASRSPSTGNNSVIELEGDIHIVTRLGVYIKTSSLSKYNRMSKPRQGQIRALHTHNVQVICSRRVRGASNSRIGRLREMGEGSADPASAAHSVRTSWKTQSMCCTSRCLSPLTEKKKNKVRSIQ